MRATFLVLAALLGFAASVSYEGYKVYKINTKSDSEVKLLALFKNDQNFDFWSELNHVGKPVTVMVAPKKQPFFEKYLKNFKITYNTEIENVESNIQAEKKLHQNRTRLGKERIAFDQYLTYDEINAYLAQLEVDYPDIVKIETIGQSYEGRDMNMIRISTGGTDKPIIWLDGGIHAREWIAPALALYVVSQLVENETNRNLIETVDWIVLPSLNPDGYVYTWDEDRFWRKTRTPGELCVGVDANRNFDYHWMESGGSSNECTETYAGPVAFSEQEAKNLRDALAANPNIKLYVDLHSYGQYLLYPWSYDFVRPDNYQELDDLGNAVNDAIAAVRGTVYDVGSPPEILYEAAGDSIDWAMGGAGIPLSYTIELPGGGTWGFDLPPEEILGVCEETWEGFKVFHAYVAPPPANSS